MNNKIKKIIKRTILTVTTLTILSAITFKLDNKIYYIKDVNSNDSILALDENGEGYKIKAKLQKGQWIEGKCIQLRFVKKSDMIYNFSIIND